MICDFHSPLTLSALLLTAWCAVGIAALVRPSSRVWAGRILFPLGAVIGMALTAVAVTALGHPVEHLILPLGLPDLPAHLRLDGLAGVFLALLGAASAGISLFAAGYFQRVEGASPGLICLQYHIFLASMGFVLLADDAYAFMLAWETMALSSYFLVTTQHRLAEIRKAGFLYLVMAHLGAISILLSFGILQGGSWQFTFDAMRGAHLGAEGATVAFCLALIGFGAKAGLVPLHVWLPEAHPAAPSPVSALMSGVMLEVALYGMIRVSFDLLGLPLWWWGLLPLALGLFSALYGVVFAAVQTDMKRLLAYSSIENIGIMFTGLGLAIVFAGVDMRWAAALTLIAVMYHAMNHAVMKSLLFLGTGAVLHATGERNLGHLGGLIRRMPWVAWLTLIGVLAIAGLPPLNGFVSEWLLFQSFLFAYKVPHPFINMLLPLGAALIALAAALAAYVMVKFFGVIFLGQPRAPILERVHDAGFAERLGLSFLALGCLLLGFFPSTIISMLGAVTRQLGLGGLPVGDAPWWLLLPIPERQSSYSPLVFFAVILVVVALAFINVRLFYHRRIRRGPAWDCGWGGLSSRMQDTAEGFGQPIRHLFLPLFAITRTLPGPFDPAPTYRLEIGDRIWLALYEPLGPLIRRVANKVAWLQQGRIATYLLYSFTTLVVLLALML